VKAALCLLPFVILATANSAGYRYGASDLAFYGPAVMRHLDPALFPRDRIVIDAQARLTLMDESVGTLARVTTRNFHVLFLGLYVGTLALSAIGAASIGDRLYRHRWSTVALLAALTLRHAIPRSGTNTLEAYFHPRQLAFAFGVLAVAAFLRGRTAGVALGLVGAALFHPTTTLWFAIWLGVATFVVQRRHRVPLALTAAAGGLIALWAFIAGPLAGRLGVMDDEWLALIAAKDYLFPLQWPWFAWLLNLAYIPIVGVIYRRRAAAGLVDTRETALVIGCLSLAVVFLIAVVLNAARVALAIQLQPARVFWMLDFLAVVYVVWAVSDANPGSVRRPVIVAAVIIAIAAIRGTYVMGVEFPARTLFDIAPAGDWGRVMAYAQSTPPSTGWLADPNHANKYGTSVRMAAARDVFVESTKDTAIGMYDRSIALRTRERLGQIDAFAQLSADRARDLGSRYELDYLITDQDLPLSLAFSSGEIRVYRLR
jgi:hypothetical protein